MSKGRLSLKSIYTDMLRGNPLGTEQEQFLAHAIDGDNVDRVAWELVSLGSRGWKALQQLFFDTSVPEVKDYVEEVLSEKQADKAMDQMMTMSRYPEMREIYDKTLLFGSNLSIAKELVYHGAKPDVVLASAYA